MAVELDVAQPFLLLPGSGEIIGDSAQRRVEILSDHDALHATWSRFGPGLDGADLHIHRRHTDLFYVLDGELTVGLGADRSETVVPAGTLVRVPPLVVHAFRNGNDAEVRYLNFHAPGADFVDYLRGRRDGYEVPSFDNEDPPADGGRPVEEASIGRGELVADRPGLRVTLLADTDAIGFAEVSSEPGQALPHRGPEFYYVLAGALMFSSGRAEPGTWVHVPTGSAPTCTVTGLEEARFLVIQAPGRGFGDALRAQLDQEPL